MPAAPGSRSHGRSRQASVLLFLMGLTTIMLVIAFSFLRSMQMSRGTSLVQRKDDLARLAADMGMQHAMTVCLHEYAMADEVRDNLTVPARSHYDSPNSNVFQLLSRRKSSSEVHIQTPQPYDMGPDLALQNLHFFGITTGRTIGFSNGTVVKPGFARWFEANRFSFKATGPGALYDPSTYDLYSTTTPNPAAVKTPFPPVEPFVRGAVITKAHPGDNPLLLDADCRPVTSVADARYRLRYAVGIDDMSAALWLNTDMPWLDAAARMQCQTAYKESVYAVGAQFAGLDYDRSDSMEAIFLGQGAYANSLFVNGQPREWPGRGGGAMWYRSPDAPPGGRALHCVFGSPAMRWNDPGGTWIGSAITSFSDLGFAMQGSKSNWHMAGEIKDNESRVRGDLVAQRCTTPFGRPQGAGTDHPWALNALMVAPRVIEAMVAAYIPPAVRGVAITSETCVPWIRTVSGANTTFAWDAGNSKAITWLIPAAANLTVDGQGPDLFTSSFQPAGAVPFAYAPPAMRDYWSTPVGAPNAPATWRASHVPVIDGRANAQRYPGELFFSDAAREPAAQSPVAWRALAADNVTAHAGSSCNPRQMQRDATPLSAPPAWTNSTAYALNSRVENGGNWFICTVAHTSSADDSNRPGVGINWTTRWSNISSNVYPPIVGSDHLGRHIVFYKADNVAGSPPAVGTSLKFLSPFFNATTFTFSNWAAEFVPAHPFGPGIAGAGSDGRLSPYRGSYIKVYTPPVPIDVNGETYPAASWSLANKLSALALHPSARGPAPLNVITPEGWSVSRSAGAHGSPASGIYLNSYYLRLALAFWHSVYVNQAANLAWANRQDVRSQTLWSPSPASLGINYTATPDLVNATSYVRKGRFAAKHASDPKGGDSWLPGAADFTTIEHLDRQFLANLGESFDHPGRRLPSDQHAVRPARYVMFQGTGWDTTVSNYQSATSLNVAEYRVTNNIRTLLTPIDTTMGGAPTLTPLSTDAQSGVNVPPHKLWLLDEWNAGNDPGYVPGTTIDTQPTRVARARAKMMERVLNDWRLSFFGAAEAYKESFRPKDFDGDNRVFCSGYLVASAADADCGLTCWKPAFGNGDGPGVGAQPGDPATGDPASRLTAFSLTGCLTLERSRQYKIRVRGELFDNFIGRAVSEQYLESALLVDPDGNVTRGGVPGNLEDAVLMFQHPVHSYYRGYLNRAYP